MTTDSSTNLDGSLQIAMPPTQREEYRTSLEEQRADAAEAELTRLRALLADRGPADDS